VSSRQPLVQRRDALRDCHGSPLSTDSPACRQAKNVSTHGTDHRKGLRSVHERQMAFLAEAGQDMPMVLWADVAEAESVAPWRQIGTGWPVQGICG
jgi:hypothetical protein